MVKLFPKSKYSPVQSICLAGLFMALAVICQKVLAINYVIPFMRISLAGPAMIITSSLLLGPWYGLLVGAGSDILGYLLLDASGGAMLPQITLIYGLLGFLSYYVFYFIKGIKNKNIIRLVEYPVFGICHIGLVLYIFLSSGFKAFGSVTILTMPQKIIISSALTILFALLVVVNELLDKHFSKKENNIYPLSNSLSLFILEVVVMIIFGSIMKGWAFGWQTYFTILLVQIMVGFFNVPLNTFLITYMSKITRKDITHE